ncbi:hypothetical protein ROLI_013220 [Roseobacter fucihabitans]|uniref:Hedgehog/Intein (Hint) domain-containing protein n=1 Tax=Roseobacter fucihabitans TaxID=1537242 RepID=A0ABZ2BQM6_9RHOB|nr:Hint domain-containing protein [Roseobacter litoralis]MBC6968128.1 hypothetical protein [Roseobacter litoralis]
MTPKTAGYVGASARVLRENTCCAPSLAGLVCGAHVLTPYGEQSVDSLRVGQSLISRDRGPVRIRKIEVVSLVTHLIYIIAGSIGHTRMDRDAMLTAQQTVLLRDWRARALFAKPAALARAKALVDGEYVRNLGQYPVTVHRIYCDAPQVIYADGLALGTADATANTLQKTRSASR